MSTAKRRVGCLLALLALVGCEQADPQQPAPVAGHLSIDTSCDPVARRCRAVAEGVAFSVRLGPGVQALRPFTVRVHTDIAAAQIRTFYVAFVMSGMDMGLNRYRLLPQADGDWLAEATLPICTSGRSDWLARIELYTDTRHWTLSVPFTLARPG